MREERGSVAKEVLRQENLLEKNLSSFLSRLEESTQRSRRFYLFSLDLSSPLLLPPNSPPSPFTPLSPLRALEVSASGLEAQQDFVESVFCYLERLTEAEAALVRETVHFLFHV